MKLTVVTPSLNQGEFLPETLASVRLAAERAPGHEIEHIVCDGGSTDRTPDILRAQSFARWTSEPDAGQSAAINRGFAQAGGDILCWLASDDLWEPDTATRVLDAFADNPAADVVYGDYFFLEGDSGWKRRKTAGPWSRARLLRGNFLSQPATFWRREVTLRHGPLDPSLRYCMDHEYWLRISADTRWLYLHEPLATMRLHLTAKTARALTAMWWESATMCQRHGCGRRAWWAALRMQLYGQYFYRLKRRLLQHRGRARQTKGVA